jgi:dipeptidyl aminopeptidase/acylaminoacyl peptidase
MRFRCPKSCSLVAALWLLAASGIGASGAEALPLASDYFLPASFAHPQLSPDGRRMAALTLHNRKHYALVLLDLQTKAGEVLVKEKEVSVVAFYWKSDYLLLLLTENTGGRWLQSLDLRTRKVNNLDRLNRESTAELPSLLPNDPEHVLAPWTDGGIRKINVSTGKAQEIERGVPGVDRWIFDADGTAWAGIGYHHNKWTFVWRGEPGTKWQRRDQLGVQHATTYPVGIMPDRKRLIVVERAPGAQTARVATFDLATTKTEAIFSHPDFDVTTVLLWGRRGEPCAAVYGLQRQQLQFFHEEAAACYAGLAAALPEHDVSTVSFSKDEKRAIVRAVHDRDEGSYYLMDRASGQVSLLGTARNSPKRDSLAASRFFETKTRDGLLLTGRVTLPTGVDRPPLIVRIGKGIPGPRALNLYDPPAQFFASRGYASARIHVPGTMGLGTTFLRAGDLELTGGMLRDLEDGIAWLEGQGWIDRERVAIFGDDFGGIVAFHAALTGRYKALVNFHTPMVLKNYDVAQLSPSDRDEAELVAMLGGSAATNRYLKSLDPLAAAAKLTLPSFHYYPRGEFGLEMTEPGRLLKTTMSKAGGPAEFYVQPIMKPESDLTTIAGGVYEAVTAFLQKHL